MKRNITDELFSKYIRLLEGGECRKCHKYFGLTQGLHCAHFITRGKRGLRWERDNATALCTKHHFEIDADKAVKNEFFLGILGKERFEELLRLEHTYRKVTKVDEIPIREDLRKKIKLLEGKW